VKYDVLVALTHLSLSTDIQLLENIPEIHLIIGGHEHVDYHLHRGSKYTPIYKADANAFSVYIHRCAFNLNTLQFRIYSTLAFVTPDVQEDENTRQVVNHWYNLAIEGFETMGYQIDRTISCLPDSVVLDGRFSSVRNFPTLLSNFTCECMLYATADSQTIVGLFDSGSIRIDDVIEGKVTEYDALRVLPYQNYLYSLSVPGALLSKVLVDGISQKGGGMFLSYCGVETKDGQTWFVNGQDISKTSLNYNVATMDYAYGHTKLNDSSVTVLKLYDITQTKSLINYLPTKYPPC
jgi:5'-nucleotidase